MLTKRQREILSQMKRHAGQEEGELVYERGIGYLGYSRVAGRTVFALLRMCAISPQCERGTALERYHINETGRNLLDGETSPDMQALAAAVRRAKVNGE